jgi:ABC-type antimicrobial peptide transport system permease subunit
MFRYAVKRILRGKGLFLSLFLSVALAATLFSGILQGADAIGVAILDNTLQSAYVDIISSAPDKNVTKTYYWEIDDVFSSVEGVKSSDHFIRFSAELESKSINGTVRTVILALPEDSSLYEGVSGVQVFEDGVIYVDASSANASDIMAGQTLNIVFETYLPYNPPGFEMRRYNYTIAGTVTLNDKAFQIGTGRYNIYLRELIQGREGLSRRPSYNMILVSENTFIELLRKVFAEQRRPTVDQTTEALIVLERENLINPWDVKGSIDRIKLIFEEINTEGASYFYVPRSYLGELLDTISSMSSQMKTSTMLVALPVFFCAWYLGMTVSEVVYSLRKREIGLLLTRGLTSRQVIYILVFEGLLVSVMSAIVGVLTGAFILMLVIPGMSIIELLRSISVLTVGATLLFSTALTIFALYRPTKKTTEISIVDALREHQTEEETLGDWQTPLLAFLLGAYKMAMLAAGITVEQFRPTTSNLIVTLLYSTWWGTDYLLGYVASILLFWGFIKLFIQYVPGFQLSLGKLASLLTGDAARFSTLSSGRNLKRVAASTFMVALIMGYSVGVIGNVASTSDFMEQAVRYTVGADASVWLFEGKDAEGLVERIGQMDGVQAVTKETHFSPDSSLGDVPIRAIKPLEWKDTAYVDEGWVESSQVFYAMDEGDNFGIMERGAAEKLGITVNNTFLVKIQSKLYPIKVVGLYGREPGEYWSVQNPTVYVNEGFLKNVKEKFIDARRILVNLDDTVDLQAFKERVEDLSTDVERVDVTALQVEKSLNNIYLAGPRRVEELGSYFAGLLASLGVVLIVSTVIRSRGKELTIMAIRGYSAGQLGMSLIFEHIGMDLLAILLGVSVGLVSLRGQTELFNQVLSAGIERRMVFPVSAQINLLVIVGLLFLATLVPIILAVRRISDSPNLKLEE